jgi:colicin import membrane protein
VLASLREEKRDHRDALAVQVEEALEREATAYREEAAAARAIRDEIAAREKAEEEARKQAEREARAKEREAAKAAKAAKEKPKPDAD